VVPEDHNEVKALLDGLATLGGLCAELGGL